MAAAVQFVRARVSDSRHDGPLGGTSGITRGTPRPANDLTPIPPHPPPIGGWRVWPTGLCGQPNEIDGGSASSDPEHRDPRSGTVGDPPEVVFVTGEDSDTTPVSDRDEVDIDHVV